MRFEGDCLLLLAEVLITPFPEYRICHRERFIILSFTKYLIDKTGFWLTNLLQISMSVNYILLEGCCNGEYESGKGHFLFFNPLKAGHGSKMIQT